MTQYIVQAKTPELTGKFGKLSIKYMDQSPAALRKAFDAVRAPIQKVLDSSGGRMVYDASTIGEPGEYRTFMLVEATPEAKEQIEKISGVHEVRPNRLRQAPPPQKSRLG